MSSGASTVKDDEPSIVVCDAGPLIHLDELDQLDLLRDFSSVCIPQQVAYEVARHRPRVPLNSLPIVIEEIEVSTDEPFRVLTRACPLIWENRQLSPSPPPSNPDAWF